jgi:hypothetical protein
MWIGFLIGFLAHPIQFFKDWWRSRKQDAAPSGEDGHSGP